MLRYVALHEDGGDFRVEPDREQHRGELDRGVADDIRPLDHGQSVEIDDPVEDLALVLTGDPVAERTEVIPELDFAGRLDAREHAGHEARGYRGHRIGLLASCRASWVRSQDGRAGSDLCPVAVGSRRAW